MLSLLRSNLNDLGCHRVTHLILSPLEYVIISLYCRVEDKDGAHSLAMKLVDVLVEAAPFLLKCTLFRERMSVINLIVERAFERDNESDAFRHLITSTNRIRREILPPIHVVDVSVDDIQWNPSRHHCIHSRLEVVERLVTPTAQLQIHECPSHDIAIIVLLLATY